MARVKFSIENVNRGTNVPAIFGGSDSVSPLRSERAKGAAKGSCGETVVQKGVFGESVSGRSLKVFRTCHVF